MLIPFMNSVYLASFLIFFKHKESEFSFHTLQYMILCLNGFIAAVCPRQSLPGNCGGSYCYGSIYQGRNHLLPLLSVNFCFWVGRGRDFSFLGDVRSILNDFHSPFHAP